MSINFAQTSFLKKSLNSNLTTLVMENNKQQSQMLNNNNNNSNNNNNNNNNNNSSSFANDTKENETMKTDRDSLVTILMERLHNKSTQMRSWAEISKTVKQTLLEKKPIAADDKYQMQKCLDIIQKNIEIKSVQSMKERLETICRQLNLTHNLNLKVNFTKTFECFVSSDMFYIEIKLDQKTGQVLDCKVAHDNEDAKSCPELITVLQKRNFAEFTRHLEGLSSIYQIGADKKIKTKIYLALQSLESDLSKLYELQLSQINEISNQIHKSPAGILEPRRGGNPMKVTFFVSPYHLIDLRTKTTLPLTVETITKRKIGFSATISIEESSTHQKLQCESLFTTSSESKKMAQFLQFSHLNSSMLPARFILKLTKPLPISYEIVRRISCLTGIQIVNNEEQRSLISLIAEQNLGSAVSNPFYTVLPDQEHCYHVNEAEMIKGIMVEKIPFTHPTNVLRIINDLRLQIMFNVILGSIVRQARGCVKQCKIFEISTSNLFNIFVQFENPKEQSLATLEIDLKDFTPTGVKCQLYPNFLANICSEDFCTKILQKSLSIPVTMRAIFNKATNHINKSLTTIKKDSNTSSNSIEIIRGNTFRVDENGKPNGYKTENVSKTEDNQSKLNEHQQTKEVRHLITGNAMLMSMLSDVPHAFAKKRKRPSSCELIDSSKKHVSSNEQEGTYIGQQKLISSTPLSSSNIVSSTDSMLIDDGNYCQTDKDEKPIRNEKQINRKISGGSTNSSTVKNDLSITSSGNSNIIIKSPEVEIIDVKPKVSAESLMDQLLLRKERKRKRTELDNKASLSDLAVSNSSIKGNAGGSDLVVTSSADKSSMKMNTSGGGSGGKVKKMTVLPSTPAKSNVQLAMKLSQMVKPKNVSSVSVGSVGCQLNSMIQSVKMVDLETAAAMAVAASSGGSSVEAVVAQAMAQAGTIDPKRFVKQIKTKTSGCSIPNNVKASMGMTPSIGSRLKEQLKASTTNLSLKQKNSASSTGFTVQKLNQAISGSQQNVFQIPSSSSSSSSSSASISISNFGGQVGKNAQKPIKKSSLTAVVDRLRQNVDSNSTLSPNVSEVSSATTANNKVDSSSNANSSLLGKGNNLGVSSASSSTPGKNMDQKQKYSIKGGTGLKTIITKNKSTVPSSTVDLISKMSSGGLFKTATKYTIPKIPKSSSSSVVTSSSGTIFTSNSITSPTLSSTGGVSPSIKKNNLGGSLKVTSPILGQNKQMPMKSNAILTGPLKLSPKGTAISQTKSSSAALDSLSQHKSFVNSVGNDRSNQILMSKAGNNTPQHYNEWTTSSVITSDRISGSSGYVSSSSTPSSPIESSPDLVTKASAPLIIPTEAVIDERKTKDTCADVVSSNTNVDMPHSLITDSFCDNYQNKIDGTIMNAESSMPATTNENNDECSGNLIKDTLFPANQTDILLTNKD